MDLETIAGIVGFVLVLGAAAAGWRIRQRESDARKPDLQFVYLGPEPGDWHEFRLLIRNKIDHILFVREVRVLQPRDVSIVYAYSSAAAVHSLAPDWEIQPAGEPHGEWSLEAILWARATNLRSRNRLWIGVRFEVVGSRQRWMAQTIASSDVAWNSSQV